MNKKAFITAIAVAIMSFVIALTMGIYLLVAGLNKEEKYILYIGSETKSISTLKNQTKSICEKYVDGYTLIEDGNGWWKDGEGKAHSEKTIIYIFCNTDESVVKALATQILKEVSDCAILMETVENSAVHSSSGYFD